MGPCEADLRLTPEAAKLWAMLSTELAAYAGRDKLLLGCDGYGVLSQDEIPRLLSSSVKSP